MLLIASLLSGCGESYELNKTEAIALRHRELDCLVDSFGAAGPYRYAGTMVGHVDMEMAPWAVVDGERIQPRSQRKKAISTKWTPS